MFWFLVHESIVCTCVCYSATRSLTLWVCFLGRTYPFRLEPPSNFVSLLALYLPSINFIATCEGPKYCKMNDISNARALNTYMIVWCAILSLQTRSMFVGRCTGWSTFCWSFGLGSWWSWGRQNCQTTLAGSTLGNKSVTGWAVDFDISFPAKTPFGNVFVWDTIFFIDSSCFGIKHVSATCCKQTPSTKTWGLIPKNFGF